MKTSQTWLLLVLLSSSSSPLPALSYKQKWEKCEKKEVENTTTNVRFEVLRTVTMQSAVLCHVVPSSPVSEILIVEAEESSKTTVQLF